MRLHLCNERFMGMVPPSFPWIKVLKDGSAEERPLSVRWRLAWHV